MNLSWPDAARVERHRIETGWVAYCPVCRRPASTEPLDHGEAAARLARHLEESHDLLFTAMLRIHLAAAAREAAAGGDPFYPTGATW